MTLTTNQHRIIDVDTHVIEPYDLWTSRMSKEKYGDLIPHVRHLTDEDRDMWFFGDTPAHGGASSAMAGWHEYPPNQPRRLEQAQRYTWEASERLKLMDGYGIDAEVLFPNVIFFHAAKMLKIGRADMMLEAVKAYNDWQTEWSSIAPKRLLPQTVLPIWDMNETLKEMERCRLKGHRGIVMTGEPHFFDLPKLSSPHWDKVWGAAQEMGSPINFHIGSGDHEQNKVMDASVSRHAEYASQGVLFFMSNASVLTQIICSGICHRFPKLNFISVESGIGWLPFALASLDWQWKNCGVAQENPEYDLLPSEYFKRQIYGTFWFEKDTLLPAIESLGSDNIMYETDFPHPTSMSPGPSTTAQRPDDYVEEVFAGVPQDVVEKILFSNAARIYGID